MEHAGDTHVLSSAGLALGSVLFCVRNADLEHAALIDVSWKFEFGREMSNNPFEIAANDALQPGCLLLR